MAEKSVAHPRLVDAAEVRVKALEIAKGYHPVQVALSKARAAQDLLAALAHPDDLVGDAIRTFRCNLTDEEVTERLEWIQGFADDALTAALDEAEVAFTAFAEEKGAAS